MEQKQEKQAQDAQELEYYSPHHTTLGGNELAQARNKHLGSLYGMEIWVANGEFIRNNVYVDFTNGGNPGRYAFVPESEIWVEARTPNDFAATCVHEFVECFNMIRKKKSYDEAHEIANRFERIVRNAVKDKKIELRTFGQVIPYLTELLSIKTDPMHKPFPNQQGVNGNRGDFGKFNSDRAAQF